MSIAGGFWKGRSGTVHALDRSVGGADATIVEIDPAEDPAKGVKRTRRDRPELAVVPSRDLQTLRDPPA